MREITQSDFAQRWAEQDREWREIRDELLADGSQVSAYDVTREQETRAMASGASLVMLFDGRCYELTPTEHHAIGRLIASGDHMTGGELVERLVQR